MILTAADRAAENCGIMANIAYRNNAHRNKLEIKRVMRFPSIGNPLIAAGLFG
jgi:hypothetical protein